ncbi:hypothetical protein OHA99_26705 [Streptomyces coelicoflavus]|uniref:hypothetical protein n=1 Tax=Streptomyces coelicoflavus TaxID=285562 RepID=UPI00324B6690
MSRKTKQRKHRADSAQIVALVQAAVPQLLRTTPDGEHEVWQCGPAVVVVPVVPDDAPVELRQALTAHRRAATTARCPHCRVKAGVTLSGVWEVRHVAACPGDPEQLVKLGERLGVEIARRV